MPVSRELGRARLRGRSTTTGCLRSAALSRATAALRASAIHDAWRDPSIAALIAVRGGYGSAQLLPLLDPDLMRAAAKVFVGYSDITALLTFHTPARSGGLSRSDDRAPDRRGRSRLRPRLVPGAP